MNALPIYEALTDLASRDTSYLGKVGKEIFALFDGAVPFEITEARDWLTTATDDNASLTGLFAHLPTCLPVYRNTYFEYEELLAVGDGKTESGHVAVLSYTTRREKRLTSEDTLWTLGASIVYSGNIYDVQDDERFPTLDESTKSAFVIPAGGAMSVFEMLYKEDNGTLGALREIRALVGFDANGDILRSGDLIAVHITSEPAPGEETDEQFSVARASLCGAAYTALFACSLLHCKNVSEELNYLPRQQARARERRNLAPIVWKTLVVEPLGKARARSDPDNSDDDTHKRRLHLCRGHFAEYGINGKGKLFGKHSGRFWIPPVVKGTASSGVVVKDYKVKKDGARP